ncbi:hypothetical protein BDP27DRAFT_680990 [Rhodocollybia butyracea]|uniref:Uncharacterized protein n=1 Tax=Rhodocollybia butyracea TaxID=206335 RepID=A0A9P5PX05_9AGAR|nr:hypothetical protein BDP27DRAFT_680990 [Rhodocollybia butyracea]
MAEESEDEFEEDAVSDDLNLEQADDYEDDHDFVEDLPKKAKGKVAAKGKGEKGKAKARHTMEEKEIIVRDERKGAASSGKIRIKPSQRVDIASVEESAVDSAPDTGKSDVAPQKKQKLPTIKKNKILTSGAPNTPVATKSAPSAAKTSTDGASTTPSTPATRVPANLQGADFNLQDRSVYDSIFKNKSGGASRSGNSRENEERRKYLDNLREADKAKRALDAKHTFDLQAQMDKISAFEDRLRRGYSSVLYPNILGAKMREVYEQERRRREPQEEGETS